MGEVGIVLEDVEENLLLISCTVHPHTSEFKQKMGCTEADRIPQLYLHVSLKEISFNFLYVRVCNMYRPIFFGIISATIGFGESRFLPGGRLVASPENSHF